LLRAGLVSSRFVGDFDEGDVYHHGAIQITPPRNREYINKYKDGLLLGANPELCDHLGYKDLDSANKREKFGIEKPAFVSQGFIFNSGFGLSVHDISFNADSVRLFTKVTFYMPDPRSWVNNSEGMHQQVALFRSKQLYITSSE
jgi:hypothetical protein